MTQPLLAPAGGSELDSLLDEVCDVLQITETQYRDAEEKYKAVGRWLADAGSPLAHLAPNIYPQGSMALQTTVKPREQEEYDLDLVLQVEPASQDPMALYDLVHDRLADHGEYAKKLERKRRCLRLNYARQFHLDILPARADAARGGTCIEVPDTKLESWKPSNPRGYAAWFEQRSRQVQEFIRREQAPLPGNPPSAAKAPLKRVVQLLKRHRDVVFNGDEDAPRSVVLTTLAAGRYAGRPSISGGLVHVLEGIVQDIRSARPRRLLVQNPSNLSERFCEAWNDETYEEFVEFIRLFDARARQLLDVRGVDRIADELKSLFGEEVSVPAVSSYMEKFNAVRSSGSLRVTAAGLTTGIGRPVPRHTFYGS